jgi:hypothetical protein
MFIPHLDVMPLIYGLIIFLGLWSMWSKLVNARFIAFIIEAGVFWLVFSLHGGTMAGGFAAAIAALLAGFFFPRMLGRKS